MGLRSLLAKTKAIFMVCSPVDCCTSCCYIRIHCKNRKTKV